ncbi:G-protein coupled receptor moody-like isoform X2 [Neocloeon triangulifer]|uniref:G-protein coupled receptor moody-like isoform X2 n=1 Tax=Neocloeon triangulifer TaxID=2078957 RepID=UPI00286F86C0|nr:G-protein coupled receptor moody-like isoform X2 [Neocloeon triangulifer]
METTGPNETFVDVSSPRTMAWTDSFADFNQTVLQDVELSKFPRSLSTFTSVITILILILGVLGNSLTIWALLKCPRVRNVAAVFIISLCVADLLFCVLVLPFSASRFLHGTWIHGMTMCVLFPFMRYGNIGVSLLSITMITINRYVMIAHHNLYARIYRKHWIAAMIAFCWVFSYGMQLPTLFGIWGSFGYDTKLGTCSILEDEQGRSSKAALFIMAFVVPCFVIILCYARIFMVVHESEKRMRLHANVNAARSPTGTVGRTEKENKRKRNEWRITKMVLAIFLSFIICYLPITIVKIADKAVKFPGLHVMGYLLLYMSACINPLIYVIMNKQYRQAYKTVLKCQRGRLLSFTHAGNTSQQAEKSRDQNCSRTMMSQVSIALNPMGNGGTSDDMPDVFDESS